MSARRYPPRRYGIAAAAGVLAALLLAGPALAQRPFRVLDPFYQGETARRTFFGSFAITGEVAYRAASPLQQTDGEGPGPLALSVRLDYALTRQLDVGAVFDVSGGLVSQLGGGPVRLSWLVVKPYWHNEDTDYALRIAVDPVSEGGLGFRQTDIAFVSSSSLSPLLSSDFAIGLRHARVGYEQLQFSDDPGLLGEATLGTEPELVRTRAIGRELHVMWGHNLYLDPAGSHLFLVLLGEAMDYDLVQTRPLSAPDAGAAEDEDDEREGHFRGGVGWVRTGIEWSRPGYQLTPFVSVPMVTWVNAPGNDGTYGPRLQHAKLGLRLTLR